MKEIAKNENFTLLTDGEGKYAVYRGGAKVGGVNLKDPKTVDLVGKALEHRAEQLKAEQAAPAAATG